MKWNLYFTVLLWQPEQIYIVYIDRLAVFETGYVFVVYKINRQIRMITQDKVWNMDQDNPGLPLPRVKNDPVVW